MALHFGDVEQLQSADGTEFCDFCELRVRIRTQMEKEMFSRVFSL